MIEETIGEEDKIELKNFWKRAKLSQSGDKA